MPVTPSPHRFVIKKPAAVRLTHLAQEATPQTSTQQFQATPRFTFASTPKSTPTQNLQASTPSATRFATPGRQHEEIIENVESSLESPIHDSIETGNHDLEHGNLSGEDADEYKIERHSSKRRRVSPSLGPPHDEQKLSVTEDEDEYPDSPLPILSSPPAPRRPPSTAASRFLLSTPAPSSTAQIVQNQNTQSFLKPPRFRPPDPAKEGNTDPLPEQFSPHRRGQKYLPGGLAAEVRDWLVNLESVVPGRHREGDGEWAARVIVDEVSGSKSAGMTLVKGRQVRSDGSGDGLGVVKVILAGEGAPFHSGFHKGAGVEVGKTVEIKSPVWEILVEGEKWGVGVEWKVLSC